MIHWHYAEKNSHRTSNWITSLFRWAWAWSRQCHGLSLQASIKLFRYKRIQRGFTFTEVGDSLDCLNWCHKDPFTHNNKSFQFWRILCLGHENAVYFAVSSQILRRLSGILSGSSGSQSWSFGRAWIRWGYGQFCSWAIWMDHPGLSEPDHTFTLMVESFTGWMVRCICINWIRSYFGRCVSSSGMDPSNSITGHLIVLNRLPAGHLLIHPNNFSLQPVKIKPPNVLNNHWNRPSTANCMIWVYSTIRSKKSWWF